ncbi:hypothetical protein HHI36_010228 [Cryptolaemus montrouzieri]|uniref:Uncharacterized protein n=1 Tax=Cryptolaemus montrouzieri TaxID=559131 RepID=A0ABD2MI25_9CUCU
MNKNNDQHEFTIGVHEYQIFVIEKTPFVDGSYNIGPKSKYLNSNEVDITVTEQISFLAESEVIMQSSHSTDNDNANVSSASTTCVSPAHHIKQEKEIVWDVHQNTSSHTETTQSEEDIKHFLKEKMQSYLSEPLLRLFTYEY